MRAIALTSPVLLLLLVACANTPQTTAYVEPDFATLDEAALAAASSDDPLAGAARRHLRAVGEPGLQALQRAWGVHVAALLGEGPAPETTPEETDRVLAAFNAVTMQYDGWASGLYWHTDLQAARAASCESGKPILNLWLLGRLDQELC